MNETDFIDQLDCNFPYHKLDEASDWISKAGDVSQNATYFVLHEILRAPPHIERDIKEVLLQMWQTEYDQDPLYRLIERALPAYRLGQPLAENIVLTRIDQLKDQPGQLYALTLLVFAAESISEPIQARYQQILDSWAADSE